MITNFGSRVFTPMVQELQERYGSRRQYEPLCGQCSSSDPLSEIEGEFIEECDSFFMATVGSSGWPYVQHRGGPKGFLKVIDAHTVAFADFRGNRQYVTTGNLMSDDRVALILVNYPRRARLKILGRADVFEGDRAAQWIDTVRDRNYKAVVERVYVIHVEALDWNCPQHIAPRFTIEELQSVVAPFEQKLQALEEENAALRSLSSAIATDALSGTVDANADTQNSR